MERKTKSRLSKDNEVIAVRFSPCVRIFIESLVNARLTTSVPGDAGTTETFVETKKDPDDPTTEH
jgi:hypothetical protein